MIVNEQAVGKKVLITTDDWFFAPDGECYKAVWGTLIGIYNDDTTLGIKTNIRSTNWYAIVGNMVIAGCQIHYAILTDEVNTMSCSREIEYNGKYTNDTKQASRIYNADEEYKK